MQDNIGLERRVELQRPLRNKLETPERYTIQSNWYLFSSMCCKTGKQNMILPNAESAPK